MEWYFIVLIIIGVLVIGGIAAMLIMTVPIGKKVYFDNLVRDKEGKWGRVCSCPTNEEQVAMWNSGNDWAETVKDKMTEVEVENDGLRLVGEFYRFGSKKKCVIILAGRTECLKYSYYFAQCYEKIGVNVLVIDGRARGNSEGVYDTIGGKESGDLIKWIRLLEERFGMEEIYCHGICIGTAAAVILMTSDRCPRSVKGLITEGLYVSFRENFKQHMICDGHPVFPVLDLVMHNIKKYAGTDVRKTAPIKLLPKFDKRILFIYGKEDKFSLPAKSELLYNVCGSKKKHIVWFDKGAHSHLRINNTEEYDAAIAEFLENDD